jgi:hypothetical protein
VEGQTHKGRAHQSVTVVLCGHGKHGILVDGHAILASWSRHQCHQIALDGLIGRDGALQPTTAKFRYYMYMDSQIIQLLNFQK